MTKIVKCTEKPVLHQQFNHNWFDTPTDYFKTQAINGWRKCNMISIPLIYFAISLNCVSIVDGSSLTSTVDKRLLNDSQELRQINDKQREEQTTIAFLTNGSASLSMNGIKSTGVYSEKTKTDASSNAGHNVSFIVSNTAQFESTGFNNVKHDNQSQEQYLPTEANVQLTNEDKTNEDMIFNKNTLPNMRYGVNSLSPKVYTWRVDKNRISLQHHLHLVPMGDEPLGAGIMKEHNYLIGILVPSCLGILGAILIIGTVCSLRYIARKRVHQPRFDDIESPGPGTPCISSISVDSTDKVFLLRGDDDNFSNGDDQN